MIDPTGEMIRPPEAAKLISANQWRKGPDGKRRPVPTHPATIIRWIRDGVGMRDGSRLRLEAVCLPSGYATTADAVREFVARLTADRLGGSAPAPMANRQRELEAVDRQLDALGV